MARLIKRGEVWTADLRPGTGREISKIRPALIFSSDAITASSPTIIVLPISSQIPPMLGIDRIIIPKNDLRLQKDSVILCGQIRAIDKVRLKKKIGLISKQRIQEVEEALKLVLGMTDLH